MSSEYYVADANTGPNFLKVGQFVSEDHRGIQLRVGAKRRLEKGERGKVKTFRRNQLRYLHQDTWLEEPRGWRQRINVFSMGSPPIPAHIVAKWKRRKQAAKQGQKED